MAAETHKTHYTAGSVVSHMSTSLLASSNGALVRVREDIPVRIRHAPSLFWRIDPLGEPVDMLGFLMYYMRNGVAQRTSVHAHTVSYKDFVLVTAATGVPPGHMPEQHTLFVMIPQSVTMQEAVGHLLTSILDQLMKLDTAQALDGVANTELRF